MCALWGTVQRQSAMLAFIDTFRAMAIVFLLVLPFLLIMKRPNTIARPAPCIKTQLTASSRNCNLPAATIRNRISNSASEIVSDEQRFDSWVSCARGALVWIPNPARAIA